MRKRERQCIFYGIVVMALVTVAGCAKTGITVTNNAITYVSLIHMAPYAPTTDVYLNGTLSSGAGGIPPGAFSAKYGGLKPGMYDFQFKKVGGDSLLADIPSSLYDTTNFYTLILFNPPGSQAAQALKIQDDFSTVSNFNTNYRFFHLAPDAPAVDLYLSGTVAQPGRTDADIVANNSYDVFQQVPAATYSLKAVLSSKPDSVLATLPATTMLAGGVYTFILTETRSGLGNTYSINVLQASY